MTSGSRVAAIGRRSHAGGARDSRGTSYGHARRCRVVHRRRFHNRRAITARCGERRSRGTRAVLAMESPLRHAAGGGGRPHWRRRHGDCPGPAASHPGGERVEGHLRPVRRRRVADRRRRSTWLPAREHRCRWGRDPQRLARRLVDHRGHRPSGSLSRRAAVDRHGGAGGVPRRHRQPVRAPPGAPCTAPSPATRGGCASGDRRRQHLGSGRSGQRAAPGVRWRHAGHRGVRSGNGRRRGDRPRPQRARRPHRSPRVGPPPRSRCRGGHG